MRLLSIEAGGPVLSAALFESGRCVEQACLRAPRRQTESLAPMVKGLLDKAGWPARTLGAVACGRGPGSFTGLRSSLAFGAGLSLAVPGLKLVAVSTLAAWAEAFCPLDRSEALVLLDGRRSQVYRAVLRRAPGGAWLDQVKPALLDLPAALAEGVAGPAAALISDMESLEGAVIPRDGPKDGADLGLAVGRLGLLELASDRPLPDWEPDYLRRSEAELLWERLHPVVAGGLEPGART